MNNKTWISILIIILVAGGIFFFIKNKKTEPRVLPVVTITAISKEGEPCGGNMMNPPKCATGLHCVPKTDSNLPMGDVGGVCQKD